MEVLFVDNDSLERLRELEEEARIIRDDTININELEAKVKESDVEAMIELGDCYFHGIEVTCDQDKAFELYEQASSLGSCEAYWRVGQCCMLGMGTYADETKAIAYLEKSAEMGSIEGSALLGTALFTGTGIKPDYDRAAKLLQYAAEGGSSTAAFLLAAMHFDGIGVEIIYDKTVYWCRNAVVDDNEDAMELLAMCYYEGLGTLKNDILAFSWFRYLANQGRPRSQYYFGKCYEYGIGVEKNIEVARGWYHKAYDNGFLEAKDKIKPTFFMKKKEAKVDIDPDGSYYRKETLPQFDMEKLSASPRATYNDKPFYGADLKEIMKKVREILVNINANERIELIETMLLSQADSFELDEASRMIYLKLVKSLIDDFPMVKQVINGEFTIPEELKKEDQIIEKKIRTLVTAKNDVILPDLVEMYMSYFKESLYLIKNRGKIKDSYNKLNAEYNILRAKLRIEKALKEANIEYIKDFVLPGDDETGKDLMADFLILDQVGIYAVSVVDNPFESLATRVPIKFLDQVKPTALDGYSKTKKCAVALETNINDSLSRIPTDYNYILPKVILASTNEIVEDDRKSNQVVYYSKLVPFIVSKEAIIEDDDLDLAVRIAHRDKLEKTTLGIDNFRKYIIDLSLSLSDYYDKLQESSKELVDYLISL